jgi:hypothetical protein
MRWISRKGNCNFAIGSLLASKAERNAERAIDIVSFDVDSSQHHLCQWSSGPAARLKLPPNSSAWQKLVTMGKANDAPPSAA